MKQQKNWEEEVYTSAERVVIDYANKSGRDSEYRAWLRQRVTNSLNHVGSLAFEEGRAEMNDCVCKEKWTFGVVHRKDIPCYLPPREQVK